MFCVANFGANNLSLSQLLVQYGRTPDICKASSLLKQLLYDIELKDHADTAEHKLLLEVGHVFFGNKSWASMFSFKRSRDTNQGLYDFASLPKLPALTVFEQPHNWPVVEPVIESCKHLVINNKFFEAAVILEDWMQIMWQNAELGGSYGNTDLNIAMLHAAVNCIAVVHFDLCKTIMHSVQTTSTVSLNAIDTDDTITMLVESGSKEELVSSPLLATDNRNIVVTGNDPQNQQAFITPKSGTLTLYPAETIVQKLLDAYTKQNKVSCNLDTVRALRFSTALYADNNNGKFYVLGLYHLKDPKKSWWSTECAHIVAMYHSVLSSLPGVESQDARVIIAGDSNLQTLADAEQCSSIVWADYQLSFGNTLLSNYGLTMLSSKLHNIALSGVQCESTSERSRALIGAIGQPSKCVDKDADDINDMANAVGKLQSSAKICALFDPFDVNVKMLKVGDVDKKTPSAQLPLDHRWISFDVGNKKQNAVKQTEVRQLNQPAISLCRVIFIMLVVIFICFACYVFLILFENNN